MEAGRLWGWCSRRTDQFAGIVVLLALLANGGAASPVGGGETADVAPFGEITRWNADHTDYGVMWEDPRDIFRVVVVFADPAGSASPDALRVEYWQSSWPKRRIPRDRPSGAGGSGWLDVGDWFRGEWKVADTSVNVTGSTYTFTFNPVNAKEFPELDDFSATYRTTLRLRLVADSPLPGIRSFATYTDSVWKEAEAEIIWGGRADGDQVWDGRLEVFNGVLQELAPLGGSRDVAVVGSDAWRSRVQGRMDGVRARLLYAETKGTHSFDETVATVRAHHATFSFAVADLLRWGHIFVPDLGVLVRTAGNEMSYAAADLACRQGGERTVYDRVSHAGEQTFPAAWGDMPPKSPQYIPLGFEGGRQHFGVEGDGNVFCVKNRRMERLLGKDSPHFGWKGEKIRYRLGLPASRPIERSLVEGDLPIIDATWEERGVRYRQRAFAIPLEGIPEAGGRIEADDTVVLMLRIDMEHVGAGTPEARLELNVRPGGGDEDLALQERRIVVSARAPERRRMLVTSPDPRES